MLYGEFIEGTGCKDNEHNFKVYKDLEIMYMNSDMGKAEIYEYGKKLVDNSKSKEALEFEARIKAEIAGLKEDIKSYKKDIEWRKEVIAEETNPAYKNMWKGEVKWRQEQIKGLRIRIKELQWILSV